MLMIEVVFPRLLLALPHSSSAECLDLESKRSTTPPPEQERITTRTRGKHVTHCSKTVCRHESSYLTVLRVAIMMLKPLQSKGASLDRNHAGKKIEKRENRMKKILGIAFSGQDR